METYMRPIVRFFREEQAATAVEYAVMLALILITVIAAIGAVGAKSGGMWGGIANSVNTLP
jgi:pilus assembly protein Flp/PilA